jgi:hypothetical protein
MKLLTLLLATALGACATAQDEAPVGAPSLAIAVGEPAPAKAQLYLDCMRQAMDARRYDREESLIRFHCDGEPAQRFYEALATRSARIGSEYTADGRTLRFVERLQEDTTGVDFCARDAAGAHSCSVVYNAGDFLTQD